MATPLLLIKKPSPAAISQQNESFNSAVDKGSHDPIQWPSESYNFRVACIGTNVGYGYVVLQYSGVFMDRLRLHLIAPDLP